MNEEPTIAVIQRCLDALQEGTASEPLVRDLLERAVRRLRLLCLKCRFLNVRILALRERHTQTEAAQNRECQRQ